ncbi:hypothetical protein D3C84_1063940 [compost metagenome]
MRPQRVIIEDLYTAAGNGAHGVFRVRRSTELAHQHQVQAHIQGGGNFISHRDTATGQGQDDHLRPVGVFEQGLHQASAGFGAVEQGGL